MNSNRIIITQPPVGNPFNIDLVKAHLNVDFDDDDDLITSLMEAAADTIDGLGVPLGVRTARLTLDYLPWEGFAIPVYPVQSLTAINYLDLSNSWHALNTSLYIVDISRRKTHITRTYNAIWPVTLPVKASVTVEFTYGYPVAPPGVIHAANLLIGHWYRNREAVIGLERSASPQDLPTGVAALLAKYSSIPFS